MKEHTTQKDVATPSVHAILQDLHLSISWGDLARRYFTQSAPWLYQRLHGIDNNGQPIAFTDEEKELLRGALYDLSERIRHAAAKL